MKALVLLFLSILSSAVLAEHPEGSAHEHFQPDVPQQFDYEEHLGCEERKCDFSDQEEPQELHETPYLNICEKFHLKMEELESLHPELKQIKLELLKKLDAYASAFDSDCKAGESIVFKILNFVLFVVEKLKVDFEKLERPTSFTELPVDPIPVEEIIAEEADYPPFIGSIRGIPGIHYPNYSEVPITSFSCSDKKHIPGFYADLETGCQVFHVCYEHRRESFLCPLGTIFNQPLLACDYWYSSNCSQAPIYYYDEHKITETIVSEEEEEKIEEFITSVIEGKTPDHSKKVLPEKEIKDLIKFFPVKAKVVDFPKEHKPVVPEPSFDVEETADKIFDGIVSAGIHTVSKATALLKSIPEPKPVFKDMPKVFKPFPIKSKLAAKTFAAVPIAKAKIVASAAVPMKAKFIASAVKAKAAAAAIPVFKAKAAAAAIPVFKAKAAAAAIPVFKAKAAAAAIPVFKAKAAAAAIPVFKAKAAAAAIPVFKAKAAAAAIPVFKAKAAAAAIPVFKAKAAAAAIPVFKAKAAAAAIPVFKAKAAAAAIPVFKAKAAAAALPIVKAKFASAAKIPMIKSKFVAAALPVVKAKKFAPYVKMAAIKSKFVVAPLTAKAVMAGVPMMKAKLAKAAMISPLTMKALALGYMKLLKVKKLALMG